MSAPSARRYVDSVRIAFRHRRDEQRLEQHATVHGVRDREETWTWERGESRVEHEVVTRRRPGVVVVGKKYRATVDVHQPSEVAWSIVRSAVAHGRAVCLRLDVAADLICPTWETAQRVRDAVLRGIVVVGARSGVRLHPGRTVYVGAERRVEFETTCDPTRTVRRRRTDQLEGACVVAYTGHQAGKKHEGHPPTLHAEIRFHGSRVVRAAVGVALKIERAWRRVYLVEDVGAVLNRVPAIVRRAAQNGEGTETYSADVQHAIRGVRFAAERRRMVRNAVPFDVWTTSLARRNFATEGERAITRREGAIRRDLRAPPAVAVPTRVHARRTTGTKPASHARTNQPASLSVQLNKESVA